MHLTNDASIIGSAHNQYPINSPYDVGEKAADDGTLYSIGVGKADITGYGSRVENSGLWKVCVAESIRVGLSWRSI